MRISRIVALLALTALVLLPFASVQAGGWASVEVENPPDEIVSGEPVTFQLVVKGHGIEPVPADSLMLVATNVDTGETFEAVAVEGDGVGVFTVEMTFPSDGDWSLEGIAAPYPPFDMAPVSVGQAAMSAQDVLVMISDAGCDELQPAARMIDTIEANGAMVGAIENAGGSLWLARDAGSMVACGTLPDSFPEGMSVISFAPVKGGQIAGIAVINRSGDAYSVAVYPVALTAPAHLATVEITGGMGGGQFGPGTLTVERGTLVTWVNDSTEGHTVVVGSDKELTSGLIGPGEKFSMEFDEAGEFPYSCGPHPNMTGTIVVI